MISHVNAEFLDCFMGGLPSATFTRFTCPLIIPLKLVVGENIFARCAQTIPAPIALKFTRRLTSSPPFQVRLQN
jgi:hypothetical protein